MNLYSRGAYEINLQTTTYTTKLSFWQDYLHFRMKGQDKFSYGYKKDDTACRLYLTLTCRSLVKKNLVKHNLNVDKDPWDEYIGILELIKEKDS